MLRFQAASAHCSNPYIFSIELIQYVFKYFAFFLTCSSRTFLNIFSIRFFSILLSYSSESRFSIFDLHSRLLKEYYSCVYKFHAATICMHKAFFCSFNLIQWRWENLVKMQFIWTNYWKHYKKNKPHVCVGERRWKIKTNWKSCRMNRDKKGGNKYRNELNNKSQIIT